MSLFDTLLDDEKTNSIQLKPFQTVKGKSESEILEWLNDTAATLQKSAEKRHQTLKNNLLTYRGQTNRGRSTNRRSDRMSTSKRESLIVNHLFDMTETKVAQLSRLKPAIEVLPTNNEFEDKNAAKATKLLIDHLWYIKDFDADLSKTWRYAKIFGEAFYFITWDKHMGEKHPEAGTVDPSDGEIIDEELKIGDVKYELEVPWRVLLDQKDKIEDVNYCFRIKVEHVEDLKTMHPEHKDKIKMDDSVRVFDSSSLENATMEDHVICFEFFHKGTQACPEGSYYKFTKDVVLEQSDSPYSHKGLPFIRLTDLDIPYKLNGVSQYEMVQPIQQMHNNLSSLISKNIWLTAHPKWMMPRGACKIESLGNDSTIVQYQGPVAPQLSQVQPNASEVYAFRDKLKEEMEQIYSVHGVSRGQPPAGVTSGVALQFLNEQEAERASAEVGKHNAFIREVARMTLAVAGDYYEADDGRMLRILGKDNRYMIKYFDTANLSKAYDIRVQNGNALADSKAGKTQRIIELIQYKPDAIGSEQLIELLELGHSDKLTTLITVAVRSAESENEDILSGKEAADPQEYEDHIVHWRIHSKQIQDRSFKEEVPVDLRAKMIDHITLTEFLMTEKAMTNPKFQAKLAELELFPMFYKGQGFIPQSQEQQAALVNGQANKGEAVTGNIPAADPQPLPGEPQRGEE